MENLPEDVKQRALKFMSEKGLSQAEFARRAGLSRSTLNQWLKGRSRIRSTNLHKVVKLLEPEKAKEEPLFTPLDKIIDHLSRAKEELKSAQGEIENLESYLVTKIGEVVSFKHYPKETDQVS
ncbi:unnamed protein product [marine sediment metagenome]|uniref:HTH cro/C1-type domain-containing protein n=1 Tax=marine sediment metagenome TaxID=412755 RepID=X1SYQ2_9ZZZZ